MLYIYSIKWSNMINENKLTLYKDDEGKVSVNTRFADEDVWLTQAQLVEIYQSSKSNISEHLTNIFADKELDQDSVVRDFRTTATEPYRIRKPLKRLSGSSKSIVSVRCGCWRATSIRRRWQVPVPCHPIKESHHGVGSFRGKASKLERY